MEKKKTKEEVLEKVIAELKKELPKDAIVERKEFGVQIYFKSQKKKELRFEGNFETLWVEYQNNRDSLEELIKSRVSVFVQSSKVVSGKEIQIKKTDIKKYARIQAKNKDWVTQLKGRTSQLKGKTGKTQLLASYPLVADILAIVVLDYPDYVMMAPLDQLKETGLTEEEVIEIAVANNNKEVYNYVIVKEGKPGVFIAVAGRQLMHNIICTPKKLVEHVSKGKKLIAVMPFRDVLFFTKFSNTPNDLLEFMKLKDLAKTLHHEKTSAYPISSTPFMIEEDGRLSKFNPRIPGVPNAKGVMMAMSEDKKTGKKTVEGLYPLGGDE